MVGFLQFVQVYSRENFVLDRFAKVYAHESLCTRNAKISRILPFAKVSACESLYTYSKYLLIPKSK